MCFSCNYFHVDVLDISFGNSKAFLSVGHSSVLFFCKNNRETHNTKPIQLMIEARGKQKRESSNGESRGTGQCTAARHL